MMIKKNHKILRQSIDSTIYGPVYGQRMHVARISVVHFHSHSHNLFVVSKIDNEIKTRRKKKIRIWCLRCVGGIWMALYSRYFWIRPRWHPSITRRTAESVIRGGRVKI